MPTNEEFVNAVFGADAPWCHVTDFIYDPNDIPKDQHLAAWKGDYFSRYKFKQNSNQYFTTSCFHADDTGTARRRKALFRHTPCIVLDDVREKLSVEEVRKLPPPSWILETSPGSEQWGFILDTPCTIRAMVENLLDGLVANGLAPDGRDPGMKGVTRFIRLPGGINNKASKLVNGQPFKCRMLLWEPFTTCTIEQLAEPFNVDLDAVRRESRVDGAADLPNHPLLHIPDIIKVKDARSDGRFDITCPWVDEHTGADDSGSAVFTNEDGSIGFKCHHGACQHRTGRHLMKFIEPKSMGFTSKLGDWCLHHNFSKVSEVNFFGGGNEKAEILPVATDNASGAGAGVTGGDDNQGTQTTFDTLLDQLRRIPPTSIEARQLVSEVLKAADLLPGMDKLHRHDQVRDIMGWSKPDFKIILKELRDQWDTGERGTAEFYKEFVFIKEQNSFYNFRTEIFFTPEAFQNSYAEQDQDARTRALQEDRVKKVDKMDYVPKAPPFFEDRGTTYANLWSSRTECAGHPGEVNRWLDHWAAMGWSEHQGHMLKFMAYTILHPEKKINHMIMLGGREGIGKDYLLYPLIKAMGNNSTTIDGEELLTGYHGYILRTKHLHINEAELGSRQEATAVSNKLKPLVCAPPDTIRVNEKFMKAMEVRNILNCTMTTNSQLPLRLSNGPSRRVYACWSNLNVLDGYDQMREEWVEYWDDRWEWMTTGGAEACIWYLKNCVDISKFNPAQPPPMTEFLREIHESSKSAAQHTIEAFIENKIGSFKSDIMTAADMSKILRSAELLEETSELLSVDSKTLTPAKVGLVLKEMPNVRQVRTKQYRLWVVRNVSSYEEMDTVEINREYNVQMKTAKEGKVVTVVK